MANKRMDQASYRPFNPDPVLSRGLLQVDRPDGSLQRRVAQGFAELADQFGRKADQEAFDNATLQGQLNGQKGAPGPASVSGGQASSTASVNGQAGHVKGARSGPGAITVMAGPADEQAKAILRQEEGFRQKAYWDTNAWRIGYGSDTITLADGSQRKVTKDSVITQADAERDLTHRLTNVEGRKAQEQLSTIWPKLPATTQAALKSVAYNYGSLPPEVVNAAQSGDLNSIGEAVAGLGSNKERRQREAALIRTGTVNKSYAAIPAGQPSAADGPVQVVPVDTPVTITPGAPGTFRPTNANTIYGRAYDVAGTNTYLQELKLTMVQDQAAVFEKYKDDPVALKKAFGELEQAHLHDHVFPDIQADYQLDFRRGQMAYENQAQSLHEAKIKEQDQASFMQRSSVLEDEKARFSLTSDPSDPNQVAHLADLQQSVDNHYDSAVSRGLMTPAQAMAAKEKSRSDLNVTFYTKQASAKSADEIAQMRKDMEADFADSGIPNLTTKDYLAVQNQLDALEKARRTQDENANKDLKTAGDLMATHMAQGLPVNKDEITRFEMNASKAPDGQNIVRSTYARMNVAKAVATLPIAEVQKNLESMLKDANGNINPDDLDFSRKLIDAHKTALMTDPIAEAEKYGLIPPDPGIPLDGSGGPQAVANAFSYRIGTAETVAKHFGVPVKYIRPDEAKAIENLVQSSPEQALTVAGGLVAASGNRAGDVLRDLGKNAPSVAQAGSIIVLGGSGQAALDALKGARGQNDNGEKLPNVNSGVLTEFDGTINGALFLHPEDARRASATAASMTRYRMDLAGIEKNDVEGQKAIYKRALNESLGATYEGDTQFGGVTEFSSDKTFWWHNSNVIVPPTIRADRFSRVISNITQSDLSNLPVVPAMPFAQVPKDATGRQYSAADIASGSPVATNGGYWISLGDPSSDNPQWIMGTDGEPLTLPVSFLERIAARIPGALKQP